MAVGAVRSGRSHAGPTPVPCSRPCVMRVAFGSRKRSSTGAMLRARTCVGRSQCIVDQGAGRERSPARGLGPIPESRARDTGDCRGVMPCHPRGLVRARSTRVPMPRTAAWRWRRLQPCAGLRADAPEPDAAAVGARDGHWSRHPPIPVRKSVPGVRLVRPRQFRVVTGMLRAEVRRNLMRPSRRRMGLAPWPGGVRRDVTPRRWARASPVRRHDRPIHPTRWSWS